MEFIEQIIGTTTIFENCRLCQETTGIHNIRSDVMLHKKISETINIIENDDSEYMMPSMVCDFCYTKIDEIYNFIKSAMEINNELRRIILTKPAFEDDTFNLITNDKIATNSELVQYFEQLKADDIEIEENTNQEINTNNENIEDTEDRNEKNELENFVQGVGDSNFSSNYSDVATNNNNSDTNSEPTDINGISAKMKNDEKKEDEVTAENVSQPLKYSSNDTSSQDSKDVIDKTFVCDICTKIFKSKVNLKRHYIIHSNLSVLCETCGKFFTNKSSLFCHEKTHLNTKLYKCDMCDTEFNTRSNLRTHIRRYHEMVRFYCSQCPKEFVTKYDLDRHEKCHVGIREFECKECSSKFFTSKELVKHQRYHEGLKKYKCKICFKAYFESHHLTIHMRSHSGERPYKCKIQGCNKSFVDSSKLKRHRNSQHILKGLV